MYSKDRKTMLDRREMLRVKVKSLAAEAAIIRKEERRTSGVIQVELRNHRVLALRSEARSAHLAYGFIKGRTLEQMEPSSARSDTLRTEPKWKRVGEIYKKYGPFTGDMPEVLKDKLKKIQDAEAQYKKLYAQAA